MLDTVHIHLFLNHFPFLGITSGLIILIVALMKKSDEMKKLSLGFLIVSSLLLIPTYFSGENSEERVEDLPGVSEAIIEKHDDSAKTAMALGALLGGLSLLSIFLKDQKQKTALIGILVLGFLTEAAIANTAKLGGQIRHTEVRDGNASNYSEKEGKDGKDSKDGKAGKEGKDGKESEEDEAKENENRGSNQVNKDTQTDSNISKTNEKGNESK